MDLRYAVRILGRAPGFTAVAVLTLALGIGTNTVVFTLYNAVAFKPIAARAPHELVRIGGSQNGRDLDPFTWEQYQRMRAGLGSMAGVIAASAPQPLAGAAPDALPMNARFVSTNYFDVLGIVPISGRSFLPQDRLVAVVSYDFWRKRLDGEPFVVSTTLRLVSANIEIVGVAPPDFAGTGVPPQMPDLWIPTDAQPQILAGVDWLHDPNARAFQVLGRLKPGVRPAQAQAELAILAQSWPLMDGKPARLNSRSATFFQTDSGEFSSFGTACAVLMVAVALVLLIGCVNLLNLCFARHAARAREFAVRCALGAGRGRLVRQLCTESLLLGVAGGALGLCCSVWACSWVASAVSDFLRRISGGALSIHLDLAPDWRVFLYTAGVSVAAGVLVGVWPALRASRADITSGLKQTSAARAGRNQGILLTAQLAGSLVLLTASGMLFRGVWRAGSVDPGFDMSRLAAVSIRPSGIASTEEARLAILRQSASRIAALSQVAAVAWTDRIPYLGHRFADFEVGRGTRIRCAASLVSENYFETLGIPLRAGRTFRPEEVERSSPVVVISEAAAARAWPGEDPIGRRVDGIDWLRGALPFRSYMVIGVVKNVRSTYLSKPDEPYLYFPKGADVPNAMLLVRTNGAAEGVIGPAERALAVVNTALPSESVCFTVRQGPGEIQRMMAQAPAAVSVVLGGLALLLATVGVFGLAVELVARRTREIAIRISLGAQRRDVVATLLRHTLRPVVAGAALGGVATAGVSALLRTMIANVETPDLTYGGSAFDPAVFSGALCVLTLAASAAMLWPARKAIGIAPTEALRSE
ncbi:MAG TPA: ADOP family duplicated permease [Candidatus Acidoferrum sp.]|nr:ADOP family duplicated permease [Candidatus Acidoferrum sp.]